MKKIILLLFVILPFFGQGQKLITGTVINAMDGEGIPGVHVLVKGTDNGVVSDLNSHFELNIKADTATILVSGMGFESQTLKVTAGKNIIINMHPTIYEIDQVVITASREQEDRNDAPISMAIMKDARLKDVKAETAGQLLNKISSVHVADFGNEQQSISIRQPLSFGRTQLVILEDGVPLGPTSIATSSDIKDMNIANIKSIEVLRGPTSSIYGSEAVGGVVNFITKNPSVFPTANIGFQQTNLGFTAIDFGAANTFNKVGIAFNGIYAQRQNGYRVNTDMNKMSLSGKVVYNIDSKTKWSTSATYKDYYTDFSGSLDSVHFYTADTSNPYLINYADMKTFRAQSTLNRFWNSSSKTFITAFYRNNTSEEIPTYRVKSDYKFPFPSYWGEFVNNDYVSYGAIVQHKQNLNFLNSTVIAGASFDFTPNNYISKVIKVHKDSLGNYDDYTLLDSCVQDFTSKLFISAFYVNFDFEPIKNLKVLAAVRYDKLYYEFDNHLEPGSASGAPDENNDFSHFSPKVGVTYNFKNKLTAYANYSVGFAPPLFSQLYKEVTVPELKPATYSNYEAGLWTYFMDKKGYFDFTIFQSNGVNEVVEVLLSDGSTISKSVGKTKHEGIEYSIRYNVIKSITIRFSGTNVNHQYVEYTDGAVDYSGNTMNIAPKFIANASIGFKPVKGIFKNFRTELEWNRISKYYMDEANSAEYGGYQIFNLRTGYSWKGLEVYLNVNNLTDELYAARVSQSVYGSAARQVVVRSYSLGFHRTFQFGIVYNFKAK